jgi:hypothetical protein
MKKYNTIKTEFLNEVPQDYEYIEFQRIVTQD